MTAYLVEDTAKGYRITLLATTTIPETYAARRIEEEGGHGPLERAYAEVADVWLHLRHTEEDRRLALWVERAKTQGWMDALGAASWTTDGNQSEESRTRLLGMIEDGDPAVSEHLPRQPDLSGEYADGWTPDKLVREVTGLDPELITGNDREAIVQAYEEKVADEFELACEHALRVALGKL